VDLEVPDFEVPDFELPGFEATLPTADDTRGFGRALASWLRAGDLVLLSGGLGAGKTTLTQGIGEGLGVRGMVTSPTFVIARVHPSLGDGPALVHVDAYRLAGLAEVDDLDLDASLDESVTVVEWGQGKAEDLSDVRLEVVLRRPARAADDDAADESRTVSVRPVGARWSSVDLAALGDRSRRSRAIEKASTTSPTAAGDE
jgi:tRNA threonylcarbamoyladenosine biosynthesis protein TsaE